MVDAEDLVEMACDRAGYDATEVSDEKYEELKDKTEEIINSIICEEQDYIVNEVKQLLK